MTANQPAEQSQPSGGAVEPEELERLEAEVARLKAEKRDDSHTGRSGDRRQPQRLGDLTHRLEELLRSRPQDTSAGEKPPVWENVAEHQADVRARAWRASLHVASHDDYADWRINQLHPDQQPSVLRNYVSAVRRGARIINLVMAGRVGSGKTTAAIAVGNAAVLERGMMTRLVKHSTYLTWLRPGGAPHDLPPWQVRDRFTRADLLILDDLGAEIDEEATEFVRRETNDLIGDRLAAGRPTVVTTNLTSEQLEAVLRERMVSRLGARAHVVKFTGTDKRCPVRW